MGCRSHSLSKQKHCSAWREPSHSLVGHKLELASKLLVAVGQPFEQRQLLDDLQVTAGLLVLEVAGVLGLWNATHKLNSKRDRHHIDLGT